MTWLLEIYRSAMFKKAVMAVTGLMLFGFVVVHMLGNLKLFFGAEKINTYAEGLREIGVPLLNNGDVVWLTRFGLLAAVALHILSAYQLTMINRRARPQGYRQLQSQSSTYASRTMRWGGVIILVFVVYHLLHLTVGSVHVDFIPHDLYHNVVTAFQNPLVAGFYMLAVSALGLHLYHGLWSLFQTLGWNGPRLNPFRRQFAIAFSVVVTAGFLSIPIAVLSGIIG